MKAQTESTQANATPSTSVSPTPQVETKPTVGMIKAVKALIKTDEKLVAAQKAQEGAIWTLIEETKKAVKSEGYDKKTAREAINLAYTEVGGVASDALLSKIIAFVFPKSTVVEKEIEKALEKGVGFNRAYSVATGSKTADEAAAPKAPPTRQPEPGGRTANGTTPTTPQQATPTTPPAANPKDQYLKNLQAIVQTARDAGLEMDELAQLTDDWFAESIANEAEEATA